MDLCRRADEDRPREEREYVRWCAQRLMRVTRTLTLHRRRLAAAGGHQMAIAAHVNVCAPDDVLSV